MSTQVKSNGTQSRLPEPETIPEGFRFTDPDDGIWGAQPLVGCLLIMIVPTFFFVALALYLSNPSIGTIMMLACMSIVVIACMIGFIKWLILLIRLEPGKVILNSYPLRLGEDHQIRYYRRLRQGQIPKRGTISGKWLCYEWVQYTRGSETKTLTETLWHMDLPECTVEKGSRVIKYDVKVDIESQVPPSFEEKHNKVRWELQVKLDCPGFAKDTSTFRFYVAPEVVG